MSDVRLVVREADQDWSGRIHGSVADLAIAALSADPVTLSELEAAVTRFTAPNTQGRLFGHLSPGLRDEPWDAGLVVIDLVSRLVVVDSTYSSPGPVGTIWRSDEENEAEIELQYHLADDWQFVHDSETWRFVAEARRRERTGIPLLDVRMILYGRPLLEFIAGEILAIFQRGDKTDSDDQTCDPFKEVHVEWLLTPRDDLRGLCPREVILERRNHLMWDLQDRSLQWSQVGECPSGLEETSFAFRHGGFGTHEWVIYYGLVRELLWSSWDQLKGSSKEPSLSEQPESFTTGDFLTTEVPRLEQVRDEWLDTPDPEYHLRTPRSIIHRERRRLPEGISGKEAIIDPDCPCCQMMGDMPGPVFWHLDGSEMDDDFAFDYQHRTREEWEQERREWEESSRRFAAEWEERQRAGLIADSPWSSSFVAEEFEGPLEARVFGIGCRLAELIAALRGEPDREETPESIQRFIDQLNRDFGNLRELFQSGHSVLDALFDPVLDRFIETLSEVSASRTDLALKCEALTHEARNLLREPPPPGRGDSSGLDTPF